MRFSVIIPCYNCVKTLKNTVSSIRACGLTDYEILLIDDGSADGTAELCDALCVQYPKLRCVHQKNAGVSAARNRGIDEAQGEYIWFVDSDDTVDAGTMEHASEIASEKKPDMLLFGMSFDYYHRGRLYEREKLLPPDEGMLTLSEVKKNFREFYDCNALTPVWNKLYRRKILLDSGVRFRRDMILMEDFLFVLELMPFCGVIYSLREVIYRYRQGEDEKRAYRRLQRIQNLAEYMLPFEESLGALGVSGKEVGMLYKMLLCQKLYYAPLPQNRRIIAEHKQSKYASIEMGSPLGIYLRNRKTQLRHRLAIAVKSCGLYRRQVEKSV